MATKTSKVIALPSKFWEQKVSNHPQIVSLRKLGVAGKKGHQENS